MQDNSRILLQKAMKALDLLLKKGKEIQGEEIQLCNDFLRDVEEYLLK